MIIQRTTLQYLTVDTRQLSVKVGDNILAVSSIANENNALVPVVKVHIWRGLLISLGFLLGSTTIIVHVCAQLGTIISKWIICAFNVNPRCKPFWHFYNRIPLEPVMYYMEYPHSDLLQLKHNSEHQKDNRFSFKTYLPYL